MKKPANINHPIHPILRNRWSPRAFSATPVRDFQEPLSGETGTGPFPTWQQRAASLLEAVNQGLFVHQMGGFRKQEVTDRFTIPAGYVPLTILAVGFYGDPGLLPEELQTREQASRERKPYAELMFSGTFGQPVAWL